MADARTKPHEAKKKSRRRSPAAAAGEDGAELLKRTADRVVKRNSAKLSKMLLEKALEGDLTSVKLLVTLAEGKKPEKRSQGPSLAEQWANQPQWEGEEEEEEEKDEPV